MRALHSPVESGHSFTFSVPPESEELSYSQRKTETKTFGGLHVDDYGIDAMKISLSGSTINQELKKIYRPQDGDEMLSGEDEIYLLRDLLKEQKTGTKNIQCGIVLYDLSKVNKSSGNRIRGYWYVFSGDFKIKRSNDRPFTYKYTIDFTAIDYDSASKFNLGDNESSGWGWVANAVNGAKKALEILKNAIQDNPIINGMKTVMSKLEEVDSNLRNLASIVDILGDTMKSFSVYTDTLAAITSMAAGILSIPCDVTQKSLNYSLEIMNSGFRFMDSVESLSRDIQAVIDDPQKYFAPQEILDQYSMTADEYKDSWKAIIGDAENNASEVVAATKNSAAPDVMISNPDTETGNPSVVLAYGDQEVTVKDTDTLESLSTKFYGTPDNAIDIAAYNGVASLDDVGAGGIIKIPITDKGQASSNNRIFSRRGNRDNYGRDIYLDDGGYTAASTTGDFKLVSGPDNLAQAILLRLRESIAKRIRLNSYGIRTNISNPTAGVAYILSSIDLAVKSDPRVKSVDNIRFSGKGDSLIVNVDYSDTNGAAGNAVGGA